MDLELQVENLDSVPEVFRQFYSKQTVGEGDDAKEVWALNPAGMAKRLANADQLRKDLEKTKASRDELEMKIADVDLDKYQELLKLESEAKKKEATSKKDFEALKQQLEAEHTQAKAKWEKERDELVAALEKEMITSAATTAVEKASGQTTALLPHVTSKLKVVRLDNGERAVRVIDPDNPEGHRNNVRTGDPMSIPDLVGELKESDDFSVLFKDESGAGSGAPPRAGAGKGAGGGGAAGVRKTPGVHIITREDAADVNKYRTAREEAAKAGAELQIEPMQQSIAGGGS